MKLMNNSKNKLNSNKIKLNSKKKNVFFSQYQTQPKRKVGIQVYDIMCIGT